MASLNTVKPFVLTSILTLGFLIALELYWRGRGFIPTYNDDKMLWANARKEIYLPSTDATVFIGGSRIKFDLDVPTWEKLTGEKAIQLAIVGTPGRSVLQHLAHDKNFKGKLIIDVAEGQFFSFVDSVRRDKSATEAIAYYKEQTPAQRASAGINFFLESKLVCLEEGKFSTTSLLNDLGFKNRPGIMVRPNFPKEFSVSNFNRQTWLTPMFLADTALINWQKRFWKSRFAAIPAIKGDTLNAFLTQTKKAIDKITARGGIVVFVRPPSSGPIIEGESRTYPRKDYWDRLLKYTASPGIHFVDYPSTAMLTCPEWSHLKLDDAVRYTTELVEILEQEHGWKFPKKVNHTAQHTNR